MKHLIFALVAAWLTACGSAKLPQAGAAAGESSSSGTATMSLSTLQPAPARLSDETIREDLQTLNRLQDRLRQLNEGGMAQTAYPLAKAQCWLDTARSQYQENDRSGYVQAALTEADRIARALGADKNATVGDDTPLVARSTRLREDLWQQLAALKRQTDTLVCTARSLACAEVRLVRAGHAEQQTGWRAATPHVAMVEDGLRRAALEAQQCAPPAPLPVAPPTAPPIASPSQPTATPSHVVILVPPPPTPAAPPPAAPPPAASPPAASPPVVEKAQPVVVEHFLLLSDVAFASNQAGLADMLPGGRQRLNTLVQHLKTYARIERLQIVGHADRLGPASRNEALSLQRAQAVRDYLGAAGLTVQQWEVVGKGASQPVSTHCPARLPRPAARACMAPDRRVEITVTGLLR